MRASKSAAGSSAIGAGVLGDETPFAGRFEDAGFVASQIALQPFQRGHRLIQPRELLLDFSERFVLVLRSGAKGIGADCA